MFARRKSPYKLTPPDKFTAHWKRAKTAFFVEAERKKPKVTKEITLFGKKMGTYKTSSTGQEKLLKIMETTIAGAYISPATRVKYDAAFTKWSNEKTKYIVLLTKTVNDAPEGVDKVKLASAAKKLKNEILAIERAIIQENNKLKNALGETKSFKFASEKLATNVRKTVAAALEFISDVREDPRPAVFNGGMPKRARDITQNIGNIDKLTDMGFEFAVKQPVEMFNLLARWGDQGRQVDEDADANAVLAEVTEFEKGVHGVARWAGSL